jgi:hypothetical protein
MRTEIVVSCASRRVRRWRAEPFAFPNPIIGGSWLSHCIPPPLIALACSPCVCSIPQYLAESVMKYVPSAGNLDGDWQANPPHPALAQTIHAYLGQ